MPTNRRPGKQQPRRPKVAGLRNRPTHNEDVPTRAAGGDAVAEAKPERADSGAAPAEAVEAVAEAKPEPADGGGASEEAEPADRGGASAEVAEAEPADGEASAEAERREPAEAEPEQVDEVAAERGEAVADAGGAAAAEAAERSATGVAVLEAEAESAPAAEPSESGGASDDAESGATARKPAWALWTATVVLAALAVWFGVEAYAVRYTGAAANEALVSAGETSEVTGQVSDAVEKLFSYDFNDTAKTETAARDLLTGPAVQRYQELFSVVKDQAPQQQLIVTTTVKERSVTRLQGDRAELLLFVDQHARRANAPGENAGPAQISVSAEKQGDTWKISQITLR
ncbi:hypothetical protein OU415_06000 [Saccharopolyspora sp. WRP15-2]|uniref:Mce-associated membrane protein n=1 Tax=Saccharopolyspora oryzae TaxID=2997343 RepID=A0ABT4UV90_9PSEU|nr:hypothetical protein [Saccharopolyspora oryzae]MDA3624977.1 hypothetical protein [Saccharopolyspora oryzae]